MLTALWIIAIGSTLAGIVALEWRSAQLAAQRRQGRRRRARGVK